MAISSYRSSFFLVLALMDINDNTDENTRQSATIEVNSSIKLFSDLFVRCKDVIMNKQKPSKFAEVFKICCDVLFATGENYYQGLVENFEDFDDTVP